MVKIVDNDYIFPGADEMFAPWNVEEPKHTDKEVFVESVLSKYVNVIHVEGEDIEDEYKAQHYTIMDLLKILKEMCEDVLVGKLVHRNSDGSYNTRILGNVRSRYKNIVEECNTWEDEECKVKV